MENGNKTLNLLIVDSAIRQGLKDENLALIKHLLERNKNDEMATRVIVHRFHECVEFSTSTGVDINDTIIRRFSTFLSQLLGEGKNGQTRLLEFIPQGYII